MNKNNKIWVYDIEIYPDFFCVTFLSISGEVKVFRLDDKVNQIQELKEFLLSDITLVGYNNKQYDDIILDYIIRTNPTNNDLFIFSGNIINSEERRFVNLSFSTIDLMKMLAHDKLKIGLKQTAVNLKFPIIQDLPYKFDEDLSTEEKKQEVMKYNLNDCQITLALLKFLKKELEMRIALSKQYNVDLRSSSRSAIGDVLFKKLYQEETGITNEEIHNFKGGTTRDGISLKDIIFPIEFKSEELQTLLLGLKQRTLVGTKKELEIEIKFRNKIYTLASGGLHSTDSSGEFTSTEEIEYIDADVTSFYPSLITRYKIFPEHLGEDFCKVVDTILQRRLIAKKAKDNTTSDALKITVNSVYGKLNFIHGWLYDPKAAMTVTYNGQLMILLLVEMLELARIKVISANTDGVTSEVKKDQKELYYSVCKEWENKTSMNLEFETYKYIARRDVNNYIAIYQSGKIKSKGGRFLTDIDLSKGFKAPIINLSIYNYFVNNIIPEETIKYIETNEEIKGLRKVDIYDYCISNKKDSKFFNELRYIKNGIYTTEKLQDTLRFFVSKKGSTLMKVNKKTLAFLNQLKGYKITPFNTYFDSSNYDLNYAYYLIETYKIINKIKSNFQYKLL